MVDTNYAGSIVKLIENPILKVFNNRISVAKFRVQLPQIRNTRIINLIFWGKLARDVATYYKVNDLQTFLPFTKEAFVFIFRVNFHLVRRKIGTRSPNNSTQTAGADYLLLKNHCKNLVF